jgi:cytochrome c biogenesis protein CcmG/thiol:disulfide interchange protein DsbE
MESNNEKITKWVENRLSSLAPPGGWQPDVSRGLQRLQASRDAQRANARRWAWGAGAVVLAGAGSLAFPATRVFADRCLTACVDQTARVSEFLRTSFGAPASGGLVEQSLRPPAPDFTLSDAAGRPVRLSDYRGKVVLLNFWATWCLPCKVEIPWFVEFERSYADQGFAVLGVSLDEEGWSAVRPYVQSKGVSYPVVIGNEDLAGLFGGIESLPTTLILDREGRVAARHVGLRAKSEYAAEIRAMLSE